MSMLITSYFCLFYILGTFKHAYYCLYISLHLLINTLMINFSTPLYQCIYHFIISLKTSLAQFINNSFSYHLLALGLLFPLHLTEKLLLLPFSRDSTLPLFQCWVVHPFLFSKNSLSRSFCGDFGACDFQLSWALRASWKMLIFF